MPECNEPPRVRRQQWSTEMKEGIAIFQHKLRASPVDIINFLSEAAVQTGKLKDCKDEEDGYTEILSYIFVLIYQRHLGLLKTPSNLALNNSRDGASTTSLGNLFQCLTTLIVKNFFPISNLNLPSFSLKPLPLVLSLRALERYSSPLIIFMAPPLDSLQQVHVLLMLGAPELNAVLQVGSHKSRVEGENPPPRPAGHASFDAAQDTVGSLGCKRTLLGHVDLVINQQPQVLLLRSALNPFSTQAVFVFGIAPTHVQDLALGLVELHEACTGPSLKPVKVPLDGIPSLQSIDCTTQLGVVSKLAEGALNPTVHVTDKDVKQHQS
ncbi:hypothetical protein QYF61_021747 [Mycteria americana]|uniref:Uncharacterized protein n=1 Tax=Mycteria americana TaxID=33587 RepID=A0AAN7S0K5_MYCAM|nr:hypothetical protein QYF61_021747 [Mycteria americana]